MGIYMNASSEICAEENTYWRHVPTDEVFMVPSGKPIPRSAEVEEVDLFTHLRWITSNKRKRRKP